MSMTLQELRDELKELYASQEYAYAMGHGCTIGSDPRLDVYRVRAEQLEAQISEMRR